MNPQITIRPETEEDHARISEINQLAFHRDDESRLVERLRLDNDAGSSLVAEINQQVVGYILLSRMFIKDKDGRIPTLALAPVAVHPDFQRRGIGLSIHLAKSISWAWS